MRGLTLWQPRATLVALGVKRIETRSWATSYRGVLAIHAAASSPRSWRAMAALGMCALPPAQSFLDALDPVCGPIAGGAEAGLPDLCALPAGGIVAFATLADVRPIGVDGLPEEWSLSEQERAFGVYGLGRYAWILDDVCPLRTPHPCRGGQRLWRLTVADYLAALDLTGAPLTRP